MTYKRLYTAFFILIFLVTAFSCNRKAFVSTGIKDKTSNESAVFNYTFSEALKQKMAGNLAEALKDFEQCIEINPASDAVYFEMAEITLSNGDYDAAKEYLGTALKLDDKNIWYLTMMAALYYQEKDLDSTIIIYRKALELYPDKDDLRLELGTVLSENSNYADAVKEFEYLDNKFGINEGSTVLKVKNLILSGRLDEAEKIVLVLINQFPGEVLYPGLLAEIYGDKGEREKALETYNKLLEENPDNSQVQLSLVDFLRKDKQYGELAGFLNTVMINTNIDKSTKVSIFMSLLEDSTLVRTYSSSLEVTAILLESEYEKDDIVTLIRPEIYTRQNRFAEAISSLEQHIKNFPDSYYAWEKLLLLYSETGDNEKLFLRAKECATKFNRSILAKLLYASAATELKEYKTSLEELKKATILANDDKDVLLQINSMEADVYYRMGDYDNSFSKYEELLKNYPGDLGILNNYAYFLAEQNRNLKEAESMSKKTILAEDKNETFLDTYAWVMFKKGNLKEAARIMEKIFLIKEPVDAEYYEHYGLILKGMKKYDMALTYLQRALQIDSSKENLKKEIEDCQAKR